MYLFKEIIKRLYFSKVIIRVDNSIFCTCFLSFLIILTCKGKQFSLKLILSLTNNHHTKRQFRFISFVESTCLY